MGKIGPKFSHLLTVRAEGADPPSPLYGQPDRKKTVFFLDDFPKPIPDAEFNFSTTTFVVKIVWHNCLEFMQTAVGGKISMLTLFACTVRNINH